MIEVLQNLISLDDG